MLLKFFTHCGYDLPAPHSEQLLLCQLIDMKLPSDIYSITKVLQLLI